MIWAGFGFMTLIAVLFAAWPLLAKGKGVVATEDGTSAVLVDQLDEVQRDHERGVISEGEADAARMEIKRRSWRCRVKPLTQARNQLAMETPPCIWPRCSFQFWLLDTIRLTALLFHQTVRWKHFRPSAKKNKKSLTWRRSFLNA